MAKNRMPEFEILQAELISTFFATVIVFYSKQVATASICSSGCWQNATV